ncbi:MAG: ATP-binding protein, partial [bacterium]|nr:ATP-binding protein [bacterium]
EIVLVLACHGAPAARAIAGAGVALAVGISEQEPLHWPDAVALSEAFFAAFLNGSEGELAFRQAVETTRFARKFEIFHDREEQTWVPPVPRGEPEFPALPRQEESPRPGFVGRERELARLLEAMERPGLAVIRGAPGQGKTELAQALLERCRLAGFPAVESLFVDLEVARTPEQIVQAAAALTPGQGGKALPSPERAGRALGSEERLVVLDNAENACESKEGREAFRELIGGILAAGKARVVVTTRTKLGWPGPKTEIRLEPLATDAEAVALLHGIVREGLGAESEARWRQILRSAELAELVGRLGRHPLSLRLAAVLLA